MSLRDSCVLKDKHLNQFSFYSCIIILTTRMTPSGSTNFLLWEFHLKTCTSNITSINLHSMSKQRCNYAGYWIYVRIFLGGIIQDKLKTNVRRFNVQVQHLSHWTLDHNLTSLILESHTHLRLTYSLQPLKQKHVCHNPRSIILPGVSGDSNGAASCNI